MIDRRFFCTDDVLEVFLCIAVYRFDFDEATNPPRRATISISPRLARKLREGWTIRLGRYCRPLSSPSLPRCTVHFIPARSLPICIAQVCRVLLQNFMIHESISKVGHFERTSHKKTAELMFGQPL